MTRPESEIDETQNLLLRQAIAELREEVPVREEWRAALLAKLPARRRRAAIMRWAPVGVAAAICLAAGIRAIGTRPESFAESGASRVRFSIRAPSALRVSLVGDFDRWDPAAVPMRRDGGGGTWTVDVHLPPGRHVFAYAVDGDLKTDPTAARAVEDDFGVPSSVIVVASMGGR